MFQNDAPNILKQWNHDPKLILKWCEDNAKISENDFKTMPKWSHSESKFISKWTQSYSKVTPNDTQNDPPDPIFYRFNQLPKQYLQIVRGVAMTHRRRLQLWYIFEIPFPATQGLSPVFDIENTQHEGYMVWHT